MSNVQLMKQVGAVLSISLRGIPKRLGACLVIVIGIAGAVAVFISVFAMSSSFTETASKSGRADRVIVLAEGATTEGASSHQRADVNEILASQAIKRDSDGKAIATADYLAFARLTDERTGVDTFATLRGTGAKALLLRPEIEIVQGRMFEAGVRELIVGRALQRRLNGLGLNDRVPLPEGDWTVVGVFESGADARESELLTDAETLLSAYQRNEFNSVTVMLDDASAFDAFRSSLQINPALSVQAKRERDYLLDASAPTTRLLELIAVVIGGIMALGAIIAAVNAMYSAISTRSMEIAILRAVGYDGAPVAISVLIEALLFALAGAALGAAIAWLFFNGNTISTQTAMGPGPMSYMLSINATVVLLGIGCGCTAGFIGGILPAMRATTAPVTAALRGT
jgi:ABC-type transport system, involved in lipoprotein release, permease component|nr:ABC transporter permease [uncultured Steroidobacter sp.]